MLESRMNALKQLDALNEEVKQADQHKSRAHDLDCDISHAQAYIDTLTFDENEKQAIDAKRRRVGKGIKLMNLIFILVMLAISVLSFFMLPSVAAAKNVTPQALYIPHGLACLIFIFSYSIWENR